MTLLFSDQPEVISLIVADTSCRKIETQAKTSRQTVCDKNKTKMKGSLRTLGFWSRASRGDQHKSIKRLAACEQTACDDDLATHVS